MYTKRHALCPFLLAVLLGLLIFPASADAGATKEKCKCDLEELNDNEDGAEVTNAAKCFLITDEERDWCTFDIESLESTTASQSELQFDEMLKNLTESQANGALARMFSEHFNQWTMWGQGAAVLREFNDIPREELASEISETLARGEEVLNSCMRKFVASDYPGDGKLIGEGRFGCGVHPNGWLTLRFDFDYFLVYYLREQLHWAVR